MLAGGRGARFGGEKALAPFRGRPLIAWSLDALAPHAAVLGVGGPAALAAEFGLAAVVDPPGAPAGALAGVLAGLAWAADNGCALLATAPCDTPFLPADMVPRLAAALGDAPVVAARAARVHALCALWRVEAAAPLAALVREGKQLSMQALIERLGGGYADCPDEAAFANLNTPEELAAAEGRALPKHPQG